jgi:hypothetical protein
MSAHQGMSRRRVCLAAPCRFRGQRKFGSRRRDRKMRRGYQPYRGTFPVARGVTRWPKAGGYVPNRGRTCAGRPGTCPNSLLASAWFGSHQGSSN